MPKKMIALGFGLLSMVSVQAFESPAVPRGPTASSHVFPQLESGVALKAMQSYFRLKEQKNVNEFQEWALRTAWFTTLSCAFAAPVDEKKRIHEQMQQQQPPWSGAGTYREPQPDRLIPLCKSVAEKGFAAYCVSLTPTSGNFLPTKIPKAIGLPNGVKHTQANIVYDCYVDSDQLQVQHFVKNAMPFTVVNVQKQRIRTPSGEIETVMGTALFTDPNIPSSPVSTGRATIPYLVHYPNDRQ